MFFTLRRNGSSLKGSLGRLQNGTFIYSTLQVILLHASLQKKKKKLLFLRVYLNIRWNDWL